MSWDEFRSDLFGRMAEHWGSTANLDTVEACANFVAERLEKANVGEPRAREILLGERYCYCPTGQCSAPRPEWCVGRRWCERKSGRPRTLLEAPRTLREALEKSLELETGGPGAEIPQSGGGASGGGNDDRIIILAGDALPTYETLQAPDDYHMVECRFVPGLGIVYRLEDGTHTARCRCSQCLERMGAKRRENYGSTREE